MFTAKRADYFPRSAYIIWQELQQTRFSGFEIEQHLLLHYRANYYFFVSPQNEHLAKRLLYGLQTAKDDGSLNVLFLVTNL